MVAADSRRSGSGLRALPQPDSAYAELHRFSENAAVFSAVGPVDAGVSNSSHISRIWY